MIPSKIEMSKNTSFAFGELNEFSTKTRAKLIVLRTYHLPEPRTTCGL